MLKSMSQNNFFNKSPVFIVGTQRSGTTLLRLMLNSHSKIAIPEEGTFWMPLLRRSKGKIDRKIKSSELKNYFKYIQNNTQFKLWGIDPQAAFDEIRREEGCTLAELMSKLYDCYASTHNKTIWGDKTPSFFRMISILSKLFPSARFIHLLRDGRDVYLSLRRMDSSKNNIGVAALEWSYKIQKAQKDLSSLDPRKVLEIRYEDLVGKPDEELKKICHFLELEYESNMSTYWQTSSHFIGAHHSNLIFKPITQSSVGRWKKELKCQELKVFEWFTGSTLESWGYQLSQKRTYNVKTVLGSLGQIFYGLPLRAIQVLYTALILKISAKYGLSTDAAGKGDQPNYQKQN